MTNGGLTVASAVRPRNPSAFWWRAASVRWLLPARKRRRPPRAALTSLSPSKRGLASVAGPTLSTNQNNPPLCYPCGRWKDAFLHRIRKSNLGVWLKVAVSRCPTRYGHGPCWLTVLFPAEWAGCRMEAHLRYLLARAPILRCSRYRQVMRLQDTTVACRVRGSRGKSRGGKIRLRHSGTEKETCGSPPPAQGHSNMYVDRACLHSINTAASAALSLLPSRTSQGFTITIPC